VLAGQHYMVTVKGFVRTFRAGRLRRMRAVLKDSKGDLWYLTIKGTL
jgi:hypothetical protein